MNSVLKITILLGCSVAAPLSFAGGQVGANSQGNGGVQDAIRYEKAKDAADARQAAKEAAHPSQVAVGTRQATEPGTVAVKDSGVQAAIQFERSKDAADARQARVDRQQGTNSNSAGNADRRMTGH